MAIRSREELLTSINERFADDTSDEVLALIEDVTDTLSDYDRRIGDSTDWESKYNQLDSEWRERYKARFFDSGEPSTESEDINILHPEEVEEEKTEYMDLFKEV